MKNHIKLKHGDELKAVLHDPIKLSIIVQIAFYMNETTGASKLKFPKSWSQQINDLVLLGAIEHNGKGVYKLKNKKIVEVTLKKKPKKAEINKQLLAEAENIPEHLQKYYEIAVSFQKLFYNNLKGIGGRVHNIENANFEKWVTPIRLMIESDKITVQQLREVWQFLQGHEFWRDKVQSTEKLRAKFDTLYSQLKANQNRDKEKKTTGPKVSAGFVQDILSKLNT